MKKLLGLVIAFALSLSCAFVIAACNNPSKPTDEDLANDAISLIRAMYSDGETSSNYNVVGQVKLDNNETYAVSWSITSEYENYSNYLKVGEMNASKLVEISVTKASDVIEYKLVASVTVGEATKTTSFNKSVPAKLYEGEGETVNAALSFSTTDNRTTLTTKQQVWQQDGIKLTNDREGSASQVADYSSPIRIYSGSAVKIEYPGMAILVFHVSHADYVTATVNSLSAVLTDADITSEELDVTVVLANPLDEIEFTATAQLRFASLEIEALADGSTDQNKVDGAKAVLALPDSKLPAVGEYILPATKNGATVTWAVKQGSDYASIKNGKLSVDAKPSQDTEVTLTATISSGSVTDTKDLTVTLVPLAITNDGTLNKPYTASEAKTVTSGTVESGATAKTLVYVKGYVIDPGALTSFGNFGNVYIADTYSADKTSAAADVLLVYNPYPDGTYLTTSGFLKGDLVVFAGYLQNYKGTTPELVAAECVSVTSVSEGMTDAEKIAFVKESLTLAKTDYSTVGEFALPASVLEDVTLTWTVADNNYVSITEDGKLSVDSLPKTVQSVVVTVKLACGSADDTLTFTINVVDPVKFEAGNYIISFDHKTNGKVYYFTGALSGNFGATSLDISSAAVVTVAEVEGGYTLYINGGVNDGKYLECAYYSATSGNFSFVEEPTGAWVYDYDLNVFTWTLDTAVYYLGMYNTYDTINVRGTSSISGENAAKVGVSEFPGAYTLVTDEVKVSVAVSALTVLLDEKVFLETAEITLPDAGDVTVSLVSSNTELVTVEDGVVKILSIPADETEVTLTATFTCGEEEDTKTFTITLTATSNDAWREATQADIKDGAKIVLTCVTSSVSVAMGAQKGAYRDIVTFDITNANIEGLVEITLVAVEGKTNTYYLQVGEDKYLYANDANALNEGAIQEGNASEWVITIDEENGTSLTSVLNDRIIRYNSSSPRFAAYKSGQLAPTIYVSADAE